MLELLIKCYEVKTFGTEDNVVTRVAKCIDNESTDGFCGIIKRERYYGQHFISRETLVKMIDDYISYYNDKRLQRNLDVLTPMEKQNIYRKVL